MTEIKLVQIDEDLKEIIPNFIQNRKKDLLKMEELLKEKNWKHIESIAHKLAGNAGSYGFDELGKIGEGLERACQKINIEDIIALSEQYALYINQLKIEYK